MENKPKKKRWKKNNIDYDGDWGNRKHYNKYGFIELENPAFYSDKNCSSEDEFFIRKPTPQERKDIVANYIRKHHKQFVDLWLLADKLAVCPRTIEKVVAELKKEGVISVINHFENTGKQLRNTYEYNGDTSIPYGTGLSLKMIYDLDNKAGFRDWDWDEYRFKTDGEWHDIRDLNFARAEKNEKRFAYLKKVKAPTACNVDKIKFLSIKYCFVILKPSKNSDERYVSLSKDGQKRYDLQEGLREFKFKVNTFSFVVKVDTDKDNLAVTLYDATDMSEIITLSFYECYPLHLENGDDGFIEKIALAFTFCSK